MLRRAAWVSLGFTLLVILWGAVVRATGSGAGCGSHWPTCNGEVIPTDPSVETLIELSHRATSGLAFLLVLGVAIAAWRARPKGHPMRSAALTALVAMIMEAAVGAGLVLLELVADDQSTARAYWMAGHLVNTFFLVAAQTATVWYAPEDARGIDRRALVGAWPLGLAMLGTLMVATTGAVTALGDTLFPAGSLSEGIAADFAATAHFLVRLRVWHPVSAVVVGVLVCVVSVWAALRRRTPEMQRLALLVVGLFLAQLVVGLLNLALLAPVWSQLVHLLMADLVWIALVSLTALSVERARVEPAVLEEAASLPGRAATSS